MGCCKGIGESLGILLGILRSVPVDPLMDQQGLVLALMSPYVSLAAKKLQYTKKINIASFKQV